MALPDRGAGKREVLAADLDDVGLAVWRPRLGLGDGDPLVLGVEDGVGLAQESVAQT